MLKANVGDDGDLRRVNDVGGVQRAAHADLQHDDIALCLGKVEHGDRRHQLELARMILHRLCFGAHAPGEAGKRIAGDVLPVHAHPLAEILDVRRGIKPRAVSRRTQDRVQHGAGAALAVAARHMDESEPLLRVAEPCKQLARALQAEARRAPAVVFDICDGFFSVHVNCFPPRRSGMRSRIRITTNCTAAINADCAMRVTSSGTYGEVYRIEIQSVLSSRLSTP